MGTMWAVGTLPACVSLQVVLIRLLPHAVILLDVTPTSPSNKFSPTSSMRNFLVLVLDEYLGIYGIIMSLTMKGTRPIAFMTAKLMSDKRPKKSLQQSLCMKSKVSGTWRRIV